MLHVPNVGKSIAPSRVNAKYVSAVWLYEHRHLHPRVMGSLLMPHRACPGALTLVPLTLWGFCLLWAFSIGYFSRYSPVFMLFELDNYDQMRLIEFETRMGAVNGQLEDLMASRWRFNDASATPLEGRRCFALMSMHRSYPYLNHSKGIAVNSSHHVNNFSQASSLLPKHCTCRNEAALLTPRYPGQLSASSYLATTHRTPIILLF